MKWKLSLPDPGMRLYYFMKFIGLAPFTVDENGFHPPTLLGKLYSASVATGLLFLGVKAFSTIFDDFKQMTVSHVTRIGIIVQICISLLNTFVTIMIFLFMHKRIVYIINKLRMIGSDLESFGIKQDPKKFFNDAFMTTVKTHATLIPVLFASAVMERWLDPLKWLKFSIDDFIHINTVLAFTQILLFIRQLLNMLNKKILKIFEAASNPRSLNRSSIFVVSRNIAQANQANVKDLTDRQSLRKIQAFYLELCNLVDQTTLLFAIPILWKTVGSCTHIILSNFSVYRSIKNFPYSHNIETVRFATDICSILIRMSIVMFQFSLIANATQETCEEGNSMGAVLFRAWYKSKPRHLEDEFIMFSLQLLNKPVTVSAFGILDLGYSCPYKILCNAVACSIILIQFETAASNPDI